MNFHKIYTIARMHFSPFVDSAPEGVSELCSWLVYVGVFHLSNLLNERFPIFFLDVQVPQRISQLCNSVKDYCSAVVDGVLVKRFVGWVKAHLQH
jgi:hypothetical protein